MALRVHAHDALHVAQLHAGAQHRIARQVRQAGGVAGSTAIFQHQAAALVVGHHLLIAGRARRGHFGRLPEAAIEGHGELAEALQAVGTGQGERRSDAHALPSSARQSAGAAVSTTGALLRAGGVAIGVACGWAWANAPAGSSRDRARARSGGASTGDSWEEGAQTNPECEAPPAGGF